jgi:hypothetical protein
VIRSQIISPRFYLTEFCNPYRNLGSRAKSSAPATEYLSTIGMRSSGIPCTSSVRNGRHAVNGGDSLVRRVPVSAIPVLATDSYVPRGSQNEAQHPCF